MVELVPHRQLSGHFFATISCILIIVLSNAVVPTSAARVCKSTSNPALCDSLTVPKGNSGNVYDSGRHYVRESLISTDKYLSLIDKYLKHPDGLSVAEIRALQDCRLLIQLSKDFFLNSFKVVNKTSKVLPTLDADDVQTKLSACLTNTQTCLDGLQQAPLKSSGVRTEIVDPLSSDAKIFQLSLDSFTKGWVPEKRKIPPRPHAPRKLPPLPHGHRPKISEHHREVYETVVSNRKLLQSNSDETVQIRDIAIVSQDGTEQYMTVSDAVAMAPLDSNSTTGYYLVYVMAGVYNEIVSIGKDQKYVMIIGDGIDKTVITGNRSVTDGYTTYNTSTFAVIGEGFVGVNFTIRNTAGPANHQAVALRNGADLSIFYSCSFDGYQDTVYAHSLRQFYRDCNIYGTVDVIFGNAAVVFQNCNIYPRQPIEKQVNLITAQGRTYATQNTGISIHNCNIKATNDLAASSYAVDTYLGRPWKQYARAVYMQSYMDNVINPAGWRDWNDTLSYLNTSYFAEYKNTGPGSDTSRRVVSPGVHLNINATEATNFTVGSFILGDSWIWQTGVPYTVGLLP